MNTSTAYEEEFLDIVDENGSPTGQVAARNIIHQQGLRHRTSHVWLVRFVNDTTEILLQKRSLEKDSFPGCYDISSAGHIPAGVDFKESALRELKEELGINGAEDELIHCGDRIIIWDDNFHGKPYHDRQYTKVFLMWKDMDEGDFSLQAEEVDSVLWMDFEECWNGVENDTFNHCIVMEELEMVRGALER